MSRGGHVFDVFVFFSSLVMAFFVSSIFSPIVITEAAENISQIAAEVSTVISVSTDKNELTFDILPDSEGVFDKKTLTATVNTNSVAGYELYFSAANNNTDMVSTVTDNKIKSDFSGEQTSATMAANQWGYSTDSTNFSVIPKKNDAKSLKFVDHYPTSTDKLTSIEIGVKVNASLASGTYTNTLLFSAIAHDADALLETFGGIETMQEMTSAVCAAETTPSATATDVTYTHTNYDGLIPVRELTDVRDGKKYKVGKYADGNCWMMDPLDMRFSSTTELNAETSDLNTKTSYKMDYVTATFDNNGSGPLFPADGKSRSVYLSNSSILKVYYNWYAAVAGSTGSDSICPKGWRLPSRGSDENGSFGKFLASYNLETDNLENITKMGTNVNSPFKFHGFYSTSSHKVVYNGTEGRYWANSASVENGYNFYFSNNKRVDNTYRNTLDLSNKSYGFIVTCVAR